MMRRKNRNEASPYRAAGQSKPNDAEQRVSILLQNDEKCRTELILTTTE